jgi:glycosidase
MKHLKYLLLFTVIALNITANSENIDLKRIDPPSWWIGMKNPNLQLLVYGTSISATTPVIDYNGITIKSVVKVQNPNYLFINLVLSPATEAGTFTINFKKGKKIVASYDYTLNKRTKDADKYTGFDASDVIYLLMPDRFANGDSSNDDVNGMLEKANRKDPNGRHGGDIKGISNHLDYIKELGCTAIWINPLLENDMPSYSYHGYAMTDFYKVDPRFGTNEDYKNLIETAHKKGIKIIQDMVFNHCGTNYFWKDDLPMPDWYNEWNKFTRSNYRGGVVTDPNASKYDYNRMVKGWFDVTMADLNQHNSFVANYLIQNSIWWIEYTGLDGIRQDTYPYPYKDFMAKWMKHLLEEYPNYNVVGEVWLNYPSSVGYWMENDNNFDGYHSNLTNVFDFPLMLALPDALNEPEGWSTGITRIYEILSQDYVYSNPYNLVVFADNHDGSRIFTKLGEDFDKYKIAMTIIATVRGIPQIYYGTEILMAGDERDGHGHIREDFPGGWENDSKNAFIERGRTKQQNDAFSFMSTLFNWRKNKEVIHTGKLTQYIPQEGVYVYFRHNDKESIMVVINKEDKENVIDLSRFDERIKNYTKGKSIFDGTVYNLNEPLEISGKTPMILELE